MAAFRCKYCGGDIYAEEGQSLVTCEYCQREQSLTKSKNELLINDFNRANFLRMKSEFDKAQEAYEKILSVEPQDSEAHWGIVLCKYGIEYVKEGDSYSEIPTCHRAQFESIFSDVDYVDAIKYADASQKRYYEAEAKKISDLQKRILRVAENEEPFDVFICYKEKDEHGQRTEDSIIANDIYYHLTQEGFKVFYAAITLEDKLGTEYEPYIFAALNSAKVMLAVGTKPEYYNAVWVKNEWSRYYQLIKKDRTRYLFPCFKNMSPYDLPEEFAHLQGQDMSKMGFIPDLIRGIKKIIPKNTPVVTESVETATVMSAASAVPLLKRAFLCIEDRDYQKAESLLEQVFNLDPECAEAYIAKMLIEKKFTTREQLYSLTTDIEDEPLYVRALRFADDNYAAVLKGYRNESIYRRANTASDRGTIENFRNAVSLYERIGNYKESEQRRKACLDGISEIRYKDAVRLALDAYSKKETKLAGEAAEIYASLGGYKDSASRVHECEELKKEIHYMQGQDSKTRATQFTDAPSVRSHYDNAVSSFAAAIDYKDAKAQIEECKSLRTEALYNIATTTMSLAEKRNSASSYIEAAKIFDEILGYKDANDLVVNCRSKANDIDLDEKYDIARNFVNRDDIRSLTEAITIYEGIIQWKDSERCLADAKSRLEVLKEKDANDKRRSLLTMELQRIREKEDKNRIAFKTVSKLKAKRTYFRVMGILVLVVALFFTAGCVNLQSTIDELDEGVMWYEVFEYYDPELYGEMAEGYTVSDINSVDPELRVFLISELMVMRGFYVLIALLSINMIITIIFEKASKVFLLLVPIANFFIAIKYIFVSIKNLILPLDSSQRESIKKINRIKKDARPMMTRKKEIEAELRSIPA